ncbi:pyrimidine reductase family protein [Mycolicibacterium sp. S2-37]|uniref:pyrimidine reductase family protein n=1 Tax=Mycolicibacterium sp. S2-37 TaxID=2810297 RepID=UPI001A93BC81|nr:pyrimidine reductase family protein [Mycolicibacterium sp. S2-37]MBO0678120.1 pyrimidine reductase family protein [Mycolicibacterium sp. S2-37]
MSGPYLATVGGLEELMPFYADAPKGLRANMIFSADGAAAFAGRAGPLSDPVDQALLRELRGFADVVLVGAGTVRAESYGPVRLSALPMDRLLPPIAVVSQSGKLPESLFADPAQRPILVTSARSAREHGLSGDDRRDVLIAGEDTVDVVGVVEHLHARGQHRILCEGGPTLLDALTGADLVDEICVTIAPRLAGVQDVGHGAGALSTPTAMRLDHVLTHSNYLFLKYSRV